MVSVKPSIISEEEYAYPFPKNPIPNEGSISIPQKRYEPFLFADDLFDGDGSYAYNLQVPQQALMKYAKSNDGSPVSFVCVMMYKALMSLHPDIREDIVFSIPHEYRKVLGCPLSHKESYGVYEVFSRAGYECIENNQRGASEVCRDALDC